VIIFPGSEEIDATEMSAEEAKNLIIQKARELGWSRFNVLVDGEPVTPAEFAEKYESARQIIVVKKDIAG